MFYHEKQVERGRDTDSQRKEKNVFRKPEQGQKHFLKIEKEREKHAHSYRKEDRQVYCVNREPKKGTKESEADQHWV